MLLGNQRQTRWESRDVTVLQARGATYSLPCTMSAMYVQLLQVRLWVRLLQWLWNPTTLKLGGGPAVRCCNRGGGNQAPTQKLHESSRN
jgi:hypothetical protein